MADTSPAPRGSRPVEVLMAKWASLDARVRGALAAAGALCAVPLAVSALSSRPVPSGIYLNGLVVGSLYALVAIGMILVYRANRIITFAQAGLGAVPAAAAVTLGQFHGLAYPLQVVVLVVTSVVLGAVIEVAVVRRFREAPRLIVTVATLGVAELLAFLELFTPRWLGGGTLIGTARYETPFSHFSWSVGGFVFRGDHVVAVVTVAVVLLALHRVLRSSDVGIAVRASAENSQRAALLGIPVAKVSTLVWATASLLAAVAVFLRAPLVGLPVGGTSASRELLIALTIAVIARMTSIPIALSAALAFGMIDQATFYVTRSDSISLGLMLPVVLAVLLVQRGQLSRAHDSAASSWRLVKEYREIPGAMRHLREVRVVRVVARVTVGVLLLAAPYLAGPLRRDLLSLIVVYAIVGVSLVILTGWAGQVSLGQFAFAGVGAAVAAHMAVEWRADFFLCLLGAGLAGAALAMVVGLPALRLQGLFLAVTTLAFATATNAILLNPRYAGWLLPASGKFAARPVLFQRFDLTSDLAYYYVCLAGLLITGRCARSLRAGRPGRVLVSLRDNTRVAQAYGVAPARTRLAAFAISGFIAAVAGGLYAFLEGAVDPGVFSPSASIVAFSVVVIGGITSVAGAAAGAAYVIGFQYLVPDYQFLATGLGVLILLVFFPGGISEVAFRTRDRWLRWIVRRRGLHVPSLARASATPNDAGQAAVTRPSANGSSATPASPVLLAVRGLDAGYDQVQVLFGVDVEVHEGEVLALLGTNGSGKSTLLNAISGLVKPSAGAVVLGTEDITGADPGRTAALGIVQMPGGRAIFPTLSVAEHLRAAGWLARHDDAGLRAAIDHVLDTFPVLRSRLDQRGGDLSGGEQQMLGLGMAFVARPRLLLIDELSLGLAPAIVAQLLQIVASMREQGTTIVLVEQSVNVALTVAERAYFLEKGQVQFSGRTRDLVGREDIVRSVFLEGAFKQADAPRAVSPKPRARSAPRTPVVLEVEGLTKQFGGVHAVNGVDFALRQGEILGLIGANGAGKTTIVDLVSGYLTPDRGRISFDGTDITAWSPERRAMAGLGRSFQDARLVSSLTVAENIAVALERHLLLRDHVAYALNLPHALAQERDVAWTVADLIDLLNLGDYRESFVRELSTGTRRIVDLAMAMAHSPQVLLLDEPAAGVARAETELLGPLLKRIQRETASSLLVIEHDMALITAISDRLIALELGQPIAEGRPSAVVKNARVIASYLGASAADNGLAGAARR